MVFLPNLGKKLDFHEIEIDCLVHLFQEIPIPVIDSVNPPFYLVLPTNNWLSSFRAHSPLIESKFTLTTKLSEFAFYGVFEITVDCNIFQIKLAQLDLAVLLFRQRSNHPEVSIVDIVRYAGIVTTKALLPNVRDYIQNNYSMLPLITSLFVSNRVVVVKVKPVARNTLNLIPTLIYCLLFRVKVF